MNLVSYVMTGVFIFMCLYLFWMWFCFGSCVKRRQKTRNPQQRRQYMGNGRRPSLTQTEPTIYVSPANLPPPPKYEAMAPPSYEEVVGIHYPGYRPPVQPITQPIAVAMAQNSTEIPNNSSHSNSNDDVTTPATVIRVTSDSRTSATVATS